MLPVATNPPKNFPLYLYSTILTIASILVIMGCEFLTVQLWGDGRSNPPEHTPLPTTDLSGGVVATPVDPQDRITDEQGVEMSLIPAGDFTMGSETGDEDEIPVHTVYLDAFYLDVYEVTNARYMQCVEAGVCSEPSSKSSYTQEAYYGNPDFSDFPVGNVDWEQAKIYCEWRGARLPTEAEWEKAARGGLIGKLYPWGDQEPDCSQANLSGCSEDPLKVGSHPQNGFGLFDMAGNVWEYVWDFYSESYYKESPSQNPQGPEDGIFHGSRGGSGFDEAKYLTSANRGWSIPFTETVYNGFRCAR